MKTSLVTGANRGIGLALVTELVRRGEAVIATARDPSTATALAALQAAHPDRVTVLALDATQDRSVAALAASVGDRAIDLLVNNAGTIGPDRQSTSEMDFDGFLETLNTNTVGPLRVTQALLPALLRSSAPKLVTISSWMGTMTHQSSDRIAYRTSKAGANKVMQALDTDLRPKGVAVLTLHPGWVRTDMGGRGADIDVLESVAGILRRIDELTTKNSGRFLNYDGSVKPW